MKRSKRAAPLAVVLLLAVYYYCGTGIFFALLISAFTHEAGHIAAIKLCGGSISDFRLDASGMTMSETGVYGIAAELFCLLSGPAAGIILAIFTSKLNSAFASYISAVSFLLSVYNLLPALPLDGGRAVFCLLNSICGSETAGRILEVSGIVTGTLLVAAGIALMKTALLIAGIWILIAQTGIVKSLRLM